MILISPIKDIEPNKVFKIEINAKLEPYCLLEFTDQKGILLAILHKESDYKYLAHIISEKEDKTLFSKETGSELKIIGHFKQVENAPRGAMQFYHN